MSCTVMFTERNTCSVTALTDNEDFNQNIISRPKGEREKTNGKPDYTRFL